jgi:AraC-like DNA-binding protein
MTMWSSDQVDQNGSNGDLSIAPGASRAAISSREFTLQRDSRRFGEDADHEHSGMEIGLLFGPGVGILTCATPSGSNNVHRLVAPVLYVVPPRTKHRTRWEVRSEVFCGHIEPRFWNRPAFEGRTATVVAGPVRVATNDLVLWEFATLLRHVWDERDFNDDRPASWLADGLLVRAAKLISGEQIDHETNGAGLSPSKRNAMDDYIDRQLRFNLHTPDLAKAVGLSVPHLTTVLKYSLGMTPHEYITRFRMMKAHQLLASGDYRLREVASAVGYDDPDHFSRKFRRFFNYPPRSLMLRARDQSSKRPGKP